MSTIKFFLVLILLTAIDSCKQDFNPEDVFRVENEFELKINLGNKKNSLDSIIIKTIYKDSSKINKLCGWFTSNSGGWEYRSFVPSWGPPEISLISNNIRFLVYKDGVVMIFKDKNAKEKEYIKKTNLSEFNFLIEN